jgi:glycerol-3-phosphate dehydrogenase (NAD(P)+)
MLPKHVSVLGAGSWGTALSVLLARNIPLVTLWGRDSDQINAICENAENQKYLPEIPLPKNLHATSNIANTVDDSLCFLIAVPSKAYRQTLESLNEMILAADRKPTDATIVWATKGFDSDNGKLLSQVTEEVFGKFSNQGVISGPSFARETAKGLPTALTLACQSETVAQSLSSWFRTESTRVYFSDDPIGVQLGGAVKNVMAIAAGISDGLGFGANARAALVTRGLSEMRRLGIELGGRSETFMGLTGVGDLILTCTDDQSRNRRFGIGLGEGKSRDQISLEIGQEIEGINTVHELFGISQRHHVDMPITEQVYQIIYDNADPAEAVQKLLRRDPKAESV